MSPIQPLSVNPRSVSSQQPSTPIVENAADQKITPQTSTPATTPANDQHDKNSGGSPQAGKSNAETSQNSLASTDNRKSLQDKHSVDSKSLPAINSASSSISLKRPTLSSKDYENISDEDYVPRQMLYDYSTWEAW